jgi:hypothetical protein
MSDRGGERGRERLRRERERDEGLAMSDRKGGEQLRETVEWVVGRGINCKRGGRRD